MNTIGNKMVKEAMHPGVITINNNTTAKDICKILSENHVSCAIVDKNKETTGIVTDTDILKTFDICTVKCMKPNFCPIIASDIMTKIISIDENENLSSAANLMTKNRIHRVFVKSNGSYIGVLSATDITREIGKTAKTASESFYSRYDKYLEAGKEEHEEHSGIDKRKIYEIMTQGVITIAINSNVRESAKLLSDKNIHRVLVMNNDGEILGLVSTTDILKIFGKEFSGRSLDDIIAGEIMTDGVKTIEQWRTIGEAVRKMKDEHIHALLVLFMQEGRNLDEAKKKSPIMAIGALHGTNLPVGFLSASDIIKAIAKV